MATNSNFRVMLGDHRYEEALAAGTISPGHLLQYDSNGKVVVHATAGGPAQLMFAMEDSLQGNTISTNYASGARVRIGIPLPGTQVYVRIADGEAIAKGDRLISAGDGTLKEHTVDSSGVVVEEHVLPLVALEACDMSSSSSVDPDPWCKCLVG